MTSTCLKKKIKQTAFKKKKKEKTSVPDTLGVEVSRAQCMQGLWTNLVVIGGHWRVLSTISFKFYLLKSLESICFSPPCSLHYFSEKDKVTSIGKGLGGQGSFWFLLFRWKR